MQVRNPAVSVEADLAAGTGRGARPLAEWALGITWAAAERTTASSREDHYGRGEDYYALQGGRLWPQGDHCGTANLRG
jgi:hypothetical protein